MLKTLRIAGRDRKRLDEIFSVTSRYGLGVLLARIGLDRSGSDDAGDGVSHSLPRRTRLAMEELGPTFVKLGQILATRADLLSPEWVAEFEQLHSKAPTLPFEELRPIVEEAHIAALAERGSAEARRFGPSRMMRQLADAMIEELDFTNEARNADRLRTDFADQPSVVVPEIHWEWTSETLLVMEYIDGVPPSNAQALVSAGLDPARIAALGADMVLDMVLVNGRFHGDPHPGNLLCLPGNHIALLDLGMVGYVSPRRREEFVSFVQALSTGSPTQLADVLTRWSIGDDVPADRVLSASERLIARHGSGRLVLGAMVTDFLGLMRDERMTLPPDLLLIFKALITMDGVLAKIEPDFDLTQAMRRSSFRIAQARLSPEHWSPILQGVAWELFKIGDDAPRLIRAAIRRLEQDGMPPSPSPPARGGSSGDIHWLAAAIVAGAVIIAIAPWFY